MKHAARLQVTLLVLVILAQRAAAREPDAVLDLWPGLAPNETTSETGEPLPQRDKDKPDIVRIGGITRPRLFAYLAPDDKRTGTAVLIFPGGGYSYVTADKEGWEVADWLNQLGISAFVVHYRTKPTADASAKESSPSPLWQRPLQDAQRAMSMVRHRAAEWNIDPSRIGVLGFSAGGNLGALVSTRFNDRSYARLEALDEVSCRPDFSLLIYPWRVVNEEGSGLVEEVTVTRTTPPMFLVHAHNDKTSPLNSAYLYAALKKNNVDAELHVYQNGGHGFGMRRVEGSNVDTWTERAEDWLRQRKLIAREKFSRDRN